MEKYDPNKSPEQFDWKPSPWATGVIRLYHGERHMISASKDYHCWHCCICGMSTRGSAHLEQSQRDAELHARQHLEKGR